MTETKNWYAVYTKPRWEKKVAELLTKKKIENYCPLNRVQKQWADRKKVVYEPLFTSYVFVRISEREHMQLLKTDGIINMIYWLGRPALIKNPEIKLIKDFVSVYKEVRLEKTAVDVSDMARIINGPLTQTHGGVMNISSKHIKIVLPSLGYVMMADVNLSDIDTADNNKQFKAFGQYTYAT